MKPSRAMIPAEISWALIALCFAWSGAGGWPLEPSYLHLALERRGEHYLWPFAISAPALALLWFSVREHLAYKYPPSDPRQRWTMVEVDTSAKVRGRLCLALGASWLYMLKVCVTLAVAGVRNGGDVLIDARANAILPLSVIGALCMFWAWYENRRVQRDIRKETAAFPAAAAR